MTYALVRREEYKAWGNVEHFQFLASALPILWEGWEPGTIPGNNTM